MRPFEQLTLAWLALRRTLAQAGRPALWAPWVALGALQVCVVAALWGFAHPWLSWFAAPALAAVAGEDILHFPRVLAVMPRLYGRVDIVVGALFGALAVGVATRRFADRYGGGAGPGGTAAVLRRAPALVVAQLPLNASLLAIGFALEGLATRLGGGVAGLALTAAGWIVPVLVQACFLFVAPLVVIEGRSAWDALRALPEIWKRGYWAAVFLGALLLIPLVPFQLLAASSATIAARGNPDLVGWLTLAQVGAGLVVGFALSGSSTLYYLSGLTEREP